MYPIVVLDGGEACTLDLLRPTCADTDADLVRRSPQLVAATHSKFASAGATILLTSTVKTLPHLHPDWRELIDLAVALAQARAGTAEVWATIGPASQLGHNWAGVDYAPRVRLTMGWHGVATRYAEAGVGGFALQSFADPIECAAAVVQVRTAMPGLPISASLTPGDDGRLLDGSDPAKALLVLRRAGATWVGFNCGSGPAAIEAAVARAPGADWAKPSRGDLPEEALLASLLRLAARCRFVGGCCGVEPATIAQLHRITATGTGASELVGELAK